MAGGSSRLESSNMCALLKNVVTGFTALIKHHEQFIVNKEDTRRILFRTGSLLSSLEDPASETGAEEEERIFLLQSKLRVIPAKLETVLRQKCPDPSKNVDLGWEVVNLIEDIREAIENYQVSVQHFIHNRDRKLITAADRILLNRLPHASDADHISRNRQGCLRGTRIQVLEDIEGWVERRDDGRVYWLNGVAGSGKTTIALTFAGRIFADRQLGASFFCSRDFADRSDLHLIFPTLAFELAHRFPSFRVCLVRIIKSNPNIGHESLFVQMEKLIIEPLQRTGLHTIIIIDALDECQGEEPTSAILSLLAQHTDKIPHVKFFVTSRPQPRIRSRLPLLRPFTDVFVLYNVDRAYMDRDIELFLKAHLSELIASRRDLGVMLPPKFINILVRRSAGLFIYADTLLKFIAADDDGLQDRLELIMSMPDSPRNEELVGIDVLYNQIINGGYIRLVSQDLLDVMQLILGTIVLVFNPLSSKTLATLLDVDSEAILEALRSLDSLIVVPDSSSHPIRTFHQSFPDYVTDPLRCKDKRFFVDPGLYHAKIAIRCLELMESRLKKNICGFPRYAMNCDVEDVARRRKECIGDAMEYACRFWVKHLCLASRADKDDVAYLLKLLRKFFELGVLPWFEVLSIMDDLQNGIHSLHDIQGWLLDTAVLELARDAERFLLYFFDVIMESAPHLYHSALPWCPASSLIRKSFRNDLAVEVDVLNGIDHSWDGCLRTIRVGAPVKSVKISHKGNLIAAVAHKTVKIFEVATGACSGTLIDHDSMVLCVAFSADDTLLVSGSNDGMVILWDIQTGGRIRAFKIHTQSVNSIAFSPSGTLVASGSNDSTIRIWDVLSDTSGCTLAHHSPVDIVDWSRDGMQVVAGSAKGKIQVWDVGKKTLLDTINGPMGHAITYSQNSSRIASSEHARIEIRDVPTGDILCSLPTENHRPSEHMRSVCFSPEGNQIAYSLGKSIHLRDLVYNATVSTFVHNSSVQSVTFSPVGNAVVSGSEDGFLKVWRVRGGPVPDAEAGRDTLKTTYFAEDGRFIAATGDSGIHSSTIRLLDASRGSYVRTLHSGFTRITSVAFSPDSSLIAAGTIRGALHVWDVNTGLLVQTIQHRKRWKGVCSEVVSICFSPNGLQLAVCEIYLSLVSLTDSAMRENSIIALFDVRTWHRLVDVHSVHDRPNIIFSADGAAIITHTSDHKVKTFKIYDHQFLPTRLVPLPDDESPTSHHMHSQSYTLSEQKDWVMDQRGRKVCWIPPDQRVTPEQKGWMCECPGKKLVIANGAGGVTILDFSKCSNSSRFS